MSEMAARVAMAICRVDCNELSPSIGGKSCGTGECKTWHVHLPDAMAAIEAMREPTQEMLTAMSIQIGNKGQSGSRERHQWYGGIDAALGKDVEPMAYVTPPKAKRQ